MGVIASFNITTMRLIQYSYPNTRVAPSLGFSRSPWAGLETEIDRWFDAAMTGLPGRNGGHHFPVDLFEDENSAYVRAELPGVSRDDIGVEIVEGALSISATRRQNDGNREQSFAFSRTIALPAEVQSEKVGAAYENGVLTVTLPKREEAKPRRITVQVS